VAEVFPEMKALEKKLSYVFRDREIFTQALRHSSYVNERGDPGLRDNERLEFLGDAVLNLVMGHILLESRPDLREGALSRMRSALVRESRLAEVARKIDIGPHILLGRGETLTGGRDKSSLLADTLEAIIAAVYLDGGFSAAFRFIETHFSDLVAGKTGGVPSEDYKTKLQEMLQSGKTAVPDYRVVEEIGPDHDKAFRVELTIGGLRFEGYGKSKKSAEQDAARSALASSGPGE
jgi:ribonuclease III